MISMYSTVSVYQLNHIHNCERMKSSVQYVVNDLYKVLEQTSQGCCFFYHCFTITDIFNRKIQYNNKISHCIPIKVFGSGYKWQK